MPERPLRVIFGGTFDPVHRGHLAAARDARRALAPEHFHFLPAGDPPHRQRTHASTTARTRMLELALQHEPGFTIDSRELNREGPSWMTVTLDSFRGEHPEDALVLAVGQDAVNALDRWHDWERLLELAHLLVLSRPGEQASYSDRLARALEPRWVQSPAALRARPAGRALSLGITPHAISSTLIRASVQDPQQLRVLVPDSVAEFIEREGLYR